MLVINDRRCYYYISFYSSTPSSLFELEEMRHLPEEVWKNVFEYCDASTVLAAEETCREWRLTCVKYDEDVWKDKIKDLWLKFEVNRPSSDSVLDRIRKLSTGKMVKMLRHIDLSRCIEKRDYQRMLLAKLVFEGRMMKELGGEDPRFKGRYLSMFYPDWSLVVAPYKAAFFYTVRDTKRKDLHTSELCMIKWMFRFKNHPYAEGMTFAISFFEDGTSYSEMQQQTYSWRVSFHVPSRNT